MPFRNTSSRYAHLPRQSVVRVSHVSWDFSAVRSHTMRAEFESLVGNYKVINVPEQSLRGIQIKMWNFIENAV